MMNKLKQAFFCTLIAFSLITCIVIGLAGAVIAITVHWSGVFIVVIAVFLSRILID